MNDRYTIKEILALASEYFAKCKIEQPRLEAEVLLANLLQSSRVDLYVNYDRPLLENEISEMRERLRRRASGEPLAYIIGEKEFMSLSFYVDKRVLIPRPETEHLAEKAQTLIKKEGLVKVVDVGTGSGALAVSIAYYCPQVKLVAIDIEKEALLVAKKNAQKHGVAERIEFLQGNLLDPLDNERESYDLILANPPYIPTADISSLSIEVQKEPIMALDGGANGLTYYPPLGKKAFSLLKTGGYLGLEIAWDQGQDVLGILLASGFRDIQVDKDYSTLDRCVWARK